MGEGKVDVEDVSDDLKEFGTTPALIKAVNNALVPVGAGKVTTRKKGTDISVPESGKGSGVLKL